MTSAKSPVSPLATAFARAAHAAHLGELSRRRRILLAFALVRCFSMSAMGLLMSASTTMLYELVRKQQTKRARGALLDGTSEPRGADPEVHQIVQATLTRVSTLATLADFFIGPVVGRLTDSFGRLPTMVSGLSTLACLRLGIAASPSLAAYTAYRVVASLATQAWMQGCMASIGDLYGRGTAEYVAATGFLSRCALAGSIFTTYCGRFIADPRKAFAIAGSLQLVAVSVLYVIVPETLVTRKSMDWSLRQLSPIAFASVFSRSRALMALAVLKTVREMPNHINLAAVYRRQRFPGYGPAQESTNHILFQAAMFASTYVRMPLMEALGLRGAAALDAWCSVATFCNSAFAPRPEFLYLNSLFMMMQCGDTAVDRCLQREAALVDIGQGELGGADGNRAFLSSLLMPHVFTELYRRYSDSFPAAPYVLAAVLSTLAAQVATPWTFGQLKSSTLEL